MTRTKTVSLALLVVCIACSAVGADLPDEQTIVSRMLDANAARKRAFHGYTAERTYEVENGSRKAGMKVRVRCDASGEKNFEVQSESGSGVIRDLVLHRMVSSEKEASENAGRSEAEITPENYKFAFAGVEEVEGRPAYRLDISPKQAKKFLLRGSIWIDAADYAVVKAEGSPAKNPSFWLRDTHITYVYGRHGKLWLPALTKSTSKVRVFGTASATIQSFDYAIVAAP